jgi:hypothetical protein
MAAPHHGARTGLNPKTLLLVNPNTVLISAGVDNSYGHPYAVAVQAYQEVAKHVFCTIAEDGKCLLTRRMNTDFHTHLVQHFAVAGRSHGELPCTLRALLLLRASYQNTSRMRSFNDHTNKDP